ncbi:MAG: hypothetical protein Q8R44_09310 [Novosphingobium sp.]|nr:hypothetical protein [Novosphingobium sp.]
MRIDPAIAALPADPAPLFGAGEAARAWTADPIVAPAIAALARFADGAGIDECPALARLFVQGDKANAFAAKAALAAVGQMRSAPLSLWPWRHFSNGVLHSVTLASAGRASLSLALIDGAAWNGARDPQAPDLAAFQPGLLHAAVVAGSACGRILRNRANDPAAARIEAESIALAPGTTLAIDGEREALALDAIGGCLMTLRLYRQPAGDAPARQYQVVSGAMVHQAAGDRADSRAELAMALLRAMGREDAAPTIAALSRKGTPPARWQALRECLALDSATGFAALLEVAGRAGDPLAAPARALAETLSAQHPAFARAREELLCRA